MRLQYDCSAAAVLAGGVHVRVALGYSLRYACTHGDAGGAARGADCRADDGHVSDMLGI